MGILDIHVSIFERGYKPGESHPQYNKDNADISIL